MTMVNRLKSVSIVLGAAAIITTAIVWADAPKNKLTTGGFNPAGVKLSDDLMGNKFAKQPVVTYETLGGETLFALQVKPTLTVTESRPRDLVIIVDTSASQAGKFLDASRKLVDQIVKSTTPKDRVSVWVFNTPKATRRLGSGLDYADNKNLMAPVMRALETEFASGAVDLKNGLNAALKDFDGKISRQQAIIYLGDGESAIDNLNEKDRYEMATKIRDAKVQFFAVPLGTAINGLNMHSLCTGTGGCVVRFSEEFRVPAKAIANVIEKLNDALKVPVLMPAKATYAFEAAEVYPTKLPPLRADSPTIVVGRLAKGKVPAKFEIKIEGKVAGVDTQATISEAAAPSSPDHFFLGTIVRQWSESSMKDAPAMLKADRTLALAYEQGRMIRDEYLTQAQIALGLNKFDTAKNLSDAAQKIDPDNSEVKALGTVIQKIGDGKLTMEQLKAATGQRIGVRWEKNADGQLAMVRENLENIAFQEPAPPKEPGKDPQVPVGDPNALLRAEQARRAILEQQVNLTVQESLARGRELLRAGDPKAAKDLLVAQRDSVRNNPDIGEALRTQLLNKMELLLADVGQRGETILRAKAEETERIARARAKLMATDTMASREERTRDRVKAFTNLMAQARHEDAYRESLVMMQELANDARPIPIATQAVYQMGQAAYNLREMRELNRIREDRFLLTMMQVEKSHIPYPDEPPVHFPPSKVWRDLLETRKKYASSDFEGDMPPRSRKRMEFLKSALENPIADVAKGEVALPFLLELLSDLASPQGADKDPSRKVTILLDVDAFRRETMGMFDPERVQIKFPTKLVGVSLATVLRVICEQLDGTYWVRRDYIEIVPAGMAIREKVTRVFPVEDLIIGIPNAINQSSLSQSISVLGATFSLGGGGGPVVFNGNAGGFGFQVFGGGGAGGAGQNGAFGAGAAGGLFMGGCNVGISGFGGGVQGQFGNLGGQFGFQGQDYGPDLVRLITEVVAKGEWSVNPALLCANGGGGGGAVDPMDQPILPPEQLNTLGYWQPARALVIRGTSRIHRTNSSKLKPKEMPVNGGDPDVIGKIAKADPKKDPKNDPIKAAPKPAETSVIVKQIIESEKNLDPEKIYQMLLDKGVTDPGEIIAVADFMVGCKQFKHAAELLKASLRTGVVAEPWVHEALAIALEGSQGSPEEIERARISAIDLAPKSAQAYIKAAKAMADFGNMDRAVQFCRVAARLEPSLPDAYVNALAFAGDKKTEVASDVSAWAAGNLLSRDWSADTLEYHLRAREHLKEQAIKLTAANKMDDVKKIQAVLDNEKRRDLVIEMLWSGPADLDLKVREPMGTVCSSTQRQTSGGGVLMCDDFTQKDDSHSEIYTASEAFSGSFQITVDQIWGKPGPLGNKATIKVTRHQGTPDQTIEIHTIDLKAKNTLNLTFEGGRRKGLASVLPQGMTPDAIRKPERDQEVMNKIRALASGNSPGMVGIGGGIGSTVQPADGARDSSDSPLVEVSQFANIASIAPGGLEFQQQTIMSKDGKKVQVKMAPVFSTAEGAKQAKMKLDFIPGAE